MEEYFNSKNIIEILIKWKYQLLIILAGSVLFAVFFSSSIFITPLFKSYTIVYPSNVAPYSDENETEQMMQIMQSKDISDSIIKKFDLPAHYGIDPGSKYFMSTLLNEYGKKIKVAKTPYEAVEIEVWDKDPKFACNIINEMLSQYNLVVRGLHKEKFLEVVNNYKVIMAMKQKELDSLAKETANLGVKYGLLEYGYQTQQVMKAYLNGGGVPSRSKEVLRLKKNLEEKGGDRQMLSTLMTNISNNYSILKLDYDRAVLDYNRNFTYVNVLNRPFPADKKAYPVRWVIVAMSAIATLMIAVIVIAILERRRRTGHTTENRIS
jgi:capsular polysaccharide biosynthesis protein